MSDILKLLKVIIGSLFKKSICYKHPFHKRDFYKHTRGQVIIFPEKCILCTLCDKRCPTHAIQVDRETCSWQISRHKCIICNHCVDICPVNALAMDNQYMKATFKKEDERYQIPKKPNNQSTK